MARARSTKVDGAGLGTVVGPGGVSVVNAVVQRPARRTVMIVVAAVVLGVLAFVADGIDGMTGQVMIAVVSSGLAWGSAALLAGRTARDRRVSHLPGFPAGPSTVCPTPIGWSIALSLLGESRSR
jgi:hypothetical protein